MDDLKQPTKYRYIRGNSFDNTSKLLLLVVISNNFNLLIDRKPQHPFAFTIHRFIK